MNMGNIKNVKLTVEVIVDVENWYNDIKKEKKYTTKNEILENIKDQFQDLEIMSNNLREYKVIDIKPTKQTEFKW